MGAFVALLAFVAIGMRRRSEPAGGSSLSRRAMVEQTKDAPGRTDGVDESEVRYKIRVRRPAGPPVVELKKPDRLGRVGRIACSTCHSVRASNPANRQPSDLDEFHTGMIFNHGKLACYSCHNPQDADRLRLADGRSLKYQDVMTLCSQCHGPRARDYERYAHGGVNGYWDLRRGDRIRNNCIDCHDPHVPQFPKMVPTFKPHDRFLVPHSEEDSGKPDMEGKFGHG